MFRLHHARTGSGASGIADPPCRTQTKCQIRLDAWVVPKGSALPKRVDHERIDDRLAGAQADSYQRKKVPRRSHASTAQKAKPGIHASSSTRSPPSRLPFPRAIDRSSDRLKRTAPQLRASSISQHPRAYRLEHDLAVGSPVPGAIPNIAFGSSRAGTDDALAGKAPRACAGRWRRGARRETALMRRVLRRFPWRRAWLYARNCTCAAEAAVPWGGEQRRRFGQRRVIAVRRQVGSRDAADFDLCSDHRPRDSSNRGWTGLGCASCEHRPGACHGRQ